ncbi:MAG: hypothetical protein ABC360_08005 [Acetomicrobium sp.]
MISKETNSISGERRRYRGVSPSKTAGTYVILVMFLFALGILRDIIDITKNHAILLLTKIILVVFLKQPMERHFQYCMLE